MTREEAAIERVRAELGPEAAEVAKGMLRRRADSRVRSLARKVGLRVRCKGGRYAILGAFTDRAKIENVNAATAIQWLIEFG